MVTKTIALEFATSMLGRLKPIYKKRIDAYIKQPTRARWEKIYSVIINGNRLPSTLWQAVLVVDPTFPRVASMDDNYKTRWTRIPSSETVLAAIRLTVFVTNDN